ncbi:hypothetical protein K438DRAFT_1787318 [Mycena galopus ATCC 62051]|nr:hypothetical protein K438DRAFT_1787318 [Mycena galopus ATCC 62051]
MPPKGSGKLLEEDFTYSEDRTKAQCKICTTGREITARSAAAHLRSAAHLQAVQLGAERNTERQRRHERLEREQAMESATDELRDIEFSTQRFLGPVATTSLKQRSAAEADMWEDYRMNGAEFSAGDPTEDTEVRNHQLREEAQVFGLWDPVGMARKLGFGDESVADTIEGDLEDGFLAEIFASVGTVTQQRKYISELAVGDTVHAHSTRNSNTPPRGLWRAPPQVQQRQRKRNEKQTATPANQARSRHKKSPPLDPPTSVQIRFRARGPWANLATERKMTSQQCWA